jgi:hypothetical protein
MKTTKLVKYFIVVIVPVAIALSIFVPSPQEEFNLMLSNIEALAQNENTVPVYDCPTGPYACVLVQLPHGQYDLYYSKR